MILFLDSETRNELDLTEVGSHKYCSHPSLEIILVGYAFGDEPVKVWEPLTEPIPRDLEEGLDDPFQMIVAWNGPGFDRLAFQKKLGKDIEIDRWEDLMVRSRYLSMPGSQGKVASILEVDTQKLVENVSTGQSVIDFFCSPLRMGGEITLFGLEPTHWRDKTTHPKEWEMLRNRVRTDVEGMREIYHRIAGFPLPDREYEFFAASERVNDRGVFTDSVLLHGAAFVGEKEQESLKKEFFELTGIIKPKSTKYVLRFVREHGYTFGSLNKQFVNRALNGECILDDVGRRVLELRLKLGKSALSKLDTIKECVQEDGRVRGLFNFMGAARTGRDSSALVQLQNLVKASKDVEKKYIRALELLRKADYEAIKREFVSPVDVAAAAIRPIFRAQSGNKLLIADLSAIEVRGSAWLAGCSKMEQMFRDHEIGCGFPDDEEHKCCNGRDPYITFAGLMDPSKTYEDIYREFKAGNKAIRTNAKPPQLGCFGKNTPVITSQGIKRIVDVEDSDLLWDGESWASHGGVVYQGEKKVLNFKGVSVTPDHEIFINDAETRQIWEIYQNTLLEKMAFDLATGLSGDLCISLNPGTSQIKKKSTTDASVPYAGKFTTYTSKTSKKEKRGPAESTPTEGLPKQKTGSIRASLRWLVETRLTNLLIGTMRFFLGVAGEEHRRIATSDEASNVRLKMSTILFPIVLLFRTTTNLSMRLIEKITMVITKKVILGLLQEDRTIVTKSASDISLTKERDSRQLSFGRNTAQDIEMWELLQGKLDQDFPWRGLYQTSQIAVESTYDLTNAGPKNRFMILTDSGPLLVHNCGYGLAAGDVEKDEEGNIVKTGLLGYAASMSIELSKEYAEDAVRVYRNVYSEICDFWYDLHRAFVNVTENDAVVELGPLTLEKKGRVLCMWLPSGRALHYINPEVQWEDAVSKKGNTYKRSVIWIDGISQETHQWTRIQTRGAKLFENAVQGLCRDILYEGLLEADRRDIPVVMRVHDELVAEVPENGNIGIEDLIDCMTRKISWCPDMFIAAEGQESPYYTK